jgi:PAP2 superfamily
MALERLLGQMGTPALQADAPLGSTPASAVAAPGQLRWWKELTLLGAGYLLYTLTRDLAPARRAAAFAHAAAIHTTERRLHLAVEWNANHWLAGHPGLAAVAGYYYATLHFAAVIAVLGWLFVRHPAHYQRARFVLVGATLSGLAVFWLYPVAPPRLTDGFVDTVVAVHTWGSWGSSGIAALANPYAAMPSLHTAWAVWAAGAVGIVARRRLIRVAVWAYPLLTVLVILATANHYVLDAVAGLLTLLVATVATGSGSHLASRTGRPRTGRRASRRMVWL